MILANLLTQATPPLRIAGIPPGIISNNDLDVTDEVLELWWETTRLLIDMAAEVREIRRQAALSMVGPVAVQVADRCDALLVRFAALEQKAEVT